MQAHAREGCRAPAAALALPVAAATRLTAAAEEAAPALGGLARAGGRIYHVSPLARKPHVQPAARDRAVSEAGLHQAYPELATQCLGVSVHL